MIIVCQTEKRAVPTACGELRRLRRGNKRVDTCGFYPLDSRFPLLLSPAKIGERRPLRKGERQSGYRYVCFVKYSQFTDSVLLHRTESLSRRDITVSRNSLVGDYRQHLRIMRSIPFIFAGAVCNNALTNCAALSCRTQRRVARMCSRTLSVNCKQVAKETLR